MKTIIAALAVLILAASTAHAQYHRGEPSEPIVGIICAPAQNYKTALGIEYIKVKENKRAIGGALIISGDPFGDSETEEEIPYSHYRVDEDHGTMSLLYLTGKGTADSLLIFGIGFGAEITAYTQVSTLTGSKWNGGSSQQIQPEAQASYRFKTSDKVCGQLGYDTMYGGFGGLWIKF